MSCAECKGCPVSCCSTELRHPTLCKCGCAKQAAACPAMGVLLKPGWCKGSSSGKICWSFLQVRLGLLFVRLEDVGCKESPAPYWLDWSEGEQETWLTLLGDMRAHQGQLSIQGSQGARLQLPGPTVPTEDVLPMQWMSLGSQCSAGCSLCCSDQAPCPGDRGHATGGTSGPQFNWN